MPDVARRLSHLNPALTDHRNASFKASFQRSSSATRVWQLQGAPSTRYSSSSVSVQKGALLPQNATLEVGVLVSLWFLLRGLNPVTAVASPLRSPSISVLACGKVCFARARVQKTKNSLPAKTEKKGVRQRKAHTHPVHVENSTYRLPPHLTWSRCTYARNGYLLKYILVPTPCFALARSRNSSLKSALRQHARMMHYLRRAASHPSLFVYRAMAFSH